MISETWILEYRATAKSLKGLLQFLERNIKESHYKNVLEACEGMLINQRYNIIKGKVEIHIDELTKTQTLKYITRVGCTFMMQLSMQESSLYNDFFDTKHDETAKKLDTYISSLNSIFYSAIRPLIISETSVRVLCDVVYILEAELSNFLTQDVKFSQFQHIANRILEDVQERLEYRT
eukprot:UN29235